MRKSPLPSHGPQIVYVNNDRQNKTLKAIYFEKLILCIQFSSVAQSYPTLCDPMDGSTPVHHQLPELAQPHVHRVSDAIQPSHPLSSPSPPVLNLSQHQGLFQ